MKALTLLLLAACLAGGALPACGGPRETIPAWERLLDLYRPGGALEPRLIDDIALLGPGAAGRLARREGDVLARLLNDRELNPMGLEAGARWFRARLIELRGPAPAPAGGLIGWVREEGGKVVWKSVAVGAVGR